MQKVENEGPFCCLYHSRIKLMTQFFEGMK